MHIPHEILDKVCDFVNDDDRSTALSLRRTSRACSIAARRCLFRRVHISVSQDGLRKFLQISSSEMLRRAVRSIMIKAPFIDHDEYDPIVEPLLPKSVVPAPVMQMLQEAARRLTNLSEVEVLLDNRLNHILTQRVETGADEQVPRVMAELAKALMSPDCGSSRKILKINRKGHPGLSWRNIFSHGHDSWSHLECYQRFLASSTSLVLNFERMCPCFFCAQDLSRHLVSCRGLRRLDITPNGRQWNMFTSRVYPQASASSTGLDLPNLEHVQLSNILCTSSGASGLLDFLSASKNTLRHLSLQTALVHKLQASSYYDERQQNVSSWKSVFEHLLDFPALGTFRYSHLQTRSFTEGRRWWLGWSTRPKWRHPMEARLDHATDNTDPMDILDPQEGDHLVLGRLLRLTRRRSQTINTDFSSVEIRHLRAVCWGVLRSRYCSTRIAEKLENMRQVRKKCRFTLRSAVHKNRVHEHCCLVWQ